MAKSKKKQKKAIKKRPKLSDYQACADWIGDCYEQAQKDWKQAQTDLKEAKSLSARTMKPGDSRANLQLRLRLAQFNLTPSLRPSNILMTEVYRLIRAYRRKEMVRKLEKFIVVRDGRPSNVRSWNNPYHVGFHLIFGPKGKKVSNQNRSKYAQMLEHACYHEVPAELLVGFLHQVGSYDLIRQKQKGRIIEPGFEKLIDKAHRGKA